MSKRKKEDVSEDGEREEGDSLTPGTSKKHPPDRKRLYQEAYRDVELVKEALTKASLKFKDLSEHVDDFLSMKGRQYVAEASKMIEKALNYTRLSDKHWVSFLWIPEVPMRQILKYLNFADKANFRLTCHCHKDIVDSFDVEFKTNKIDLFVPGYYRNDKYSYLSEPLSSKKDIKLQCDDELTATDKKIISEVSDRLVELTGPPEAIDCVESTAVNNLEKIIIEAKSSNNKYLPFSISSFAGSLTMLELSDVDLSNLENREFSLPHLEVLTVKRFKGESGFGSLLASCADSVKKLTVVKPSNRSSSFNLEPLQESGVVLKKILKIHVDGWKAPTEILILLKLASTKLQDLCLCGVGRQKDLKPEHVDFTLQRLENLSLQKCGFSYLCVLTRFITVPTLRNVQITQLLGKKNFQCKLPNTITKLKLDATNVDNLEEVKKLIVETAASIEELDLTKCNIQLDNSVSEFPKLKRARFRRCYPQLEADIVNRSPNLKDLNIHYPDNIFESYQENTSVEKLFILVEKADDARQGLTCALSKFLNMTEFHVHAISSVIDEVGIKKGKLTKLSVSKTELIGIRHTMNACSSTLEELELIDNSTYDEWECVRIRGDEEINSIKLKEMTALKTITIQASSKNLNLDSDMCRLGSCGFYQLLDQCKNTLERLTIYDPRNKVKERDFLSLKLDLPNLKILQIDPRPSKQAMLHISNQLPKDVVYWFDFTVVKQNL